MTNYLFLYRFYPTPSMENPQELIQCPQDTFTANPCNPNGAYPFECAEGHTGRLCSSCLPGYRRDGTKKQRILKNIVLTICFRFHLQQM